MVFARTGWARATTLMLAASLTAFASASPAWAEDAAEASAAVPASNRGTTFQADYFTQFAPATALDIVRRVPGFVLEETDGETRGFSGTAGNVVLNGARPASKSQSLSEMLSQIPASRVLRVEVNSGDVYGSDYSGKSQVLNVILTKAGGLDGSVTAKISRLHDGTLLPNVEASALIRSGASTFNISARNGRGGAVEVGYDAVRRLSDGTLLEYRDKTNDIDNYNPNFALSWSHDGGQNRKANINLRYAPGRFKLGQANHVTPLTGPIRDDRLEQDYRNTNYELGGDLTRPLGAGAIKLVALLNRRDRDNVDAYYNRIGTAVTGGFEQFQDARYDEALGRLSWMPPKLAGFTIEFGSEVAYNKLVNATELFLIDQAGARSRIDLPIDNATVDELRTETYLNLGRQLSGRLRLDTSLAYETSQLEVSGDTTARRSLSFLKPGTTLDWKGDKGWHVQASLRREVAQLDFYDFISLAELANDRISGGNANLQPQRSWEARLTVERPVLGRGLAKLEVGHDWVSMLQDRILTPEGYDAPGNIGKGTYRFISGTFDAPLDKLGLKATRIKLEGGLQETSVSDPLTGQTRPWSGFNPDWFWNLELRRDLAKWSYGMTMGDNAPGVFHRISEVDSFFNNRPFGTAFVEFRPDKRTTLRLDVENILDTAGQRFREFYAPNRTVQLPSTTEFRYRNQHAAVQLTITRTFGGK